MQIEENILLPIARSLFDKKDHEIVLQLFVQREAERKNETPHREFSKILSGWERELRV